jgi:arsenate reductase
MSSVSVEVYGLPHCTTCQRALQYLRDRGVSISRFRDVKAEPLHRSEVEELAKKVIAIPFVDIKREAPLESRWSIRATIRVRNHPC